MRPGCFPAGVIGSSNLSWVPYDYRVDLYQGDEQRYRCCLSKGSLFVCVIRRRRIVGRASFEIPPQVFSTNQLTAPLKAFLSVFMLISMFVFIRPPVGIDQSRSLS